jgi:hypothetical protein
MRKYIIVALLIVALISEIASQDLFSGTYHPINQAQYDSEKKWIEIKRNQYQEIVINSEYYSNAVAYYDSENQELFFVIKKPAQYDTFMKIKFIKNGCFEIYMLAQEKWTKSEYIYQK